MLSAHEVADVEIPGLSAAAARESLLCTPVFLVFKLVVCDPADMGRHDDLAAMLFVAGLKLASQYTEGVDDPLEDEYDYVHVGEPTVAMSTSFTASTANRPLMMLARTGHARWRKWSSR